MPIVYMVGQTNSSRQSAFAALGSSRRRTATAS